MADWQDPQERIRDLESQVEHFRKDLADAASDYPIEIPEPGTPLAVLLQANRLLKAEVERLLDAAWAYRQLSMCYRVGKTPSEALFKKLEKASKALEGEQCPECHNTGVVGEGASGSVDECSRCRPKEER